MSQWTDTTSAPAVLDDGRGYDINPHVASAADSGGPDPAAASAAGSPDASGAGAPDASVGSPDEAAAGINPADVRSGRSAADLDAGFNGSTAGLSAPEADLVTDGDGSAAPGFMAASLDDILESLKDVVDPELGVNIVDLGLIYDLAVSDEQVLTLDMTLTSAACPLTDMIEDQVAAALMPAEGSLVADYKINWVWLPPWGPDKITDDGREQLQALGFNI